MNKLSPWFYGWNIVAMTFFLQFLVMGSGYYIFGVLLKPLSETLDASRFVVSLALTGQIIMSAVLGPWLGRAVGERSIRGLMTTGILVMAAGLAGISLAETIWQFYIAFMLLGIGGFCACRSRPQFRVNRQLVLAQARLCHGDLPIWGHVIRGALNSSIHLADAHLRLAHRPPSVRYWRADLCTPSNLVRHYQDAKRERSQS